MNASERAQDAYGLNAAPIRSPRAAEYDAIARVSHRLRTAALARKTDYPTFVAAISENRRLWSTLAIDVARAANGLPKDLRARLFWLAEFTEAESRRILQGTGDVAVLIEVNAAVLQGLRGAAKEEAPA